MRHVLCIFVLVLVTISASPQATKSRPTRTFNVEEVDGGSVVTNLGYGIAVNKGSSLHRRWFVLNDPTAPLSMIGTGVTTKYTSGRVSGDYSYEPTGSVTSKVPVTAFEVRFLLFDIWGKHMKTLSSTDVTDLQPGTPFNLETSGSWRTWESDVSELQTVVAFVAHVRLADGTVWAYDSASLVREIQEIKLKLTESELAPEKRKE
jgi:hypothetical protein